MSAAIKLGLLGAKGRMGQMIAREISPESVLAAQIDKDSSAAEKAAAFQSCDVLIDFSAPKAAVEHAALAALHQKPLVVGTTGLSEVEEAALKAAAQKTAVFYAANMSLGVNILAVVVEQVAAKLNTEFDIEIFEAHHRHKVDAPSGTALLLAQAAARGRGARLQDALVPARHGEIGPRPVGAIGMSVFRGGDVVGDHTVTFAGMGERLELSHKASDRAIFARGALKAALWLADKKPGLYSMRDMLGL